MHQSENEIRKQYYSQEHKMKKTFKHLEINKSIIFIN